MDVSNALSSMRIDDEDDSLLVVESEAMKKVLMVSRKLATVDSTVLLHGETGTGKSVLAHYIHRLSSRRHRPFLTINCSTIPENLLEAELFGYAAGAFTGALKDGRIGLIEAANHGTLFLDEIGELPLRMQPKLLHVIQCQEFIPVGTLEPKKVNVRIIAATNCNLQEMVRRKQFREDLYYRLNVLDIKLPPLRERKDDFIPLINHFLQKHDLRFGGNHRISDQAMKMLQAYTWPGNIRQLENLLEKLIITTDHVIDADDLPDSIRFFRHDSDQSAYLTSLGSALAEVEKKLICETYLRLKSSRRVANYLQISQSKASRLIRKYCDLTDDQILD